MGFFDRFSGKKPDATGVPAAADTPVTGGGVLPQLVSAREKLEAKDLPAAMALYEQVLASAGDRADVLVTISADLGVNGYVREIVDLVAPRYDADRHGPATGLNLLQAYLALRQADAAQHVLDILFSLQRPELEDRLHGFSNAIAELINSDLPETDATGGGAPGNEPPKVNFVSISKPIWFYGLEPLAAEILPPKAGRLRRVAFTQLAAMGVPDLGEVMQKPETEIGRLTRALPLWFAEAFYFSPHYSPIAVIGVMDRKHYALLGTEWSNENLRQLIETTGGGLDYIFSGAIRRVGEDYEVILRLWEVKKLRERKTFTARWSAATADAELRQLHEQVRAFMEWTAEKTGVPYAPPAHPARWLSELGTSLTLFLADKEMLTKEQLASVPETLADAAEQANESDAASLAWLTLSAAARRHGLIDASATAEVRSTPIVEQARQLMAGA